MNSIKIKFMKTTKLWMCALGVIVFAAFVLVGCDKLDIYSVDAPSDLQARIDSIEAANSYSGDTTKIDISTYTVGATDESTVWWRSFSDYFAVPVGKVIHLEFENISNCYTTGINYQNWALINANMEANSANNTEATTYGLDYNKDYKEYFAFRADAWGWSGVMASENSDYTFYTDSITKDYSDINGDGDIWDDFRYLMQDAKVTIEIEHSYAGRLYITATMVGKGIDGNQHTLVEQYDQPVGTDVIYSFLTCEGSYLQMKRAYSFPSKYPAVDDQNPVSITISGTPSFVELGNTNFWGSGIAKVTYADGSIAKVDSADLSFTVVPDMTTAGAKTVAVSYSKTLLGEYCQAVSNIYTLEVTYPVSSIAVTTMPTITTYYFYNSDSITFNTNNLVVTATYTNGSTNVLANSSLKFSKIPAAEGSKSVDITYVGATKTVTTTCPLTLVKGVSQVGATNFSSVWWTVFSSNYTVASGTSKIFTMYCYSDNVSNWHSPCAILRKASDLPTSTEYAVVRMDNYGWKGDVNTSSGLTTLGWTLTSNWDWTTFTSNISGSKVVITVTNKGDNTADILYNVTYANGTTHYQKYAGITVDKDDLSCALVTEESYLVLTE
jgi:hypothetical protein